MRRVSIRGSVTDVDTRGELLSSHYVRLRCVTYRQAGAGEEPLEWDCAIANDVVVCLLYHRARDAFICVKQFRPAVYASMSESDRMQRSASTIASSLLTASVLGGTSSGHGHSHDPVGAGAAAAVPMPPLPPPPSPPEPFAAAVAAALDPTGSDDGSGSPSPSPPAPAGAPPSSLPAELAEMYECAGGLRNKVTLSPLQQVAEEVLEETGYAVTQDALHLMLARREAVGVCGYATAIYYGEVDDSMRVEGKGGGCASEHEVLEVVELPVEEVPDFLLDHRRAKSTDLTQALHLLAMPPAFVAATIARAHASAAEGFDVALRADLQGALATGAPRVTDRLHDVMRRRYPSAVSPAFTLLHGEPFCPFGSDASAVASGGRPVSSSSSSHGGTNTMLMYASGHLRRAVPSPVYLHESLWARLVRLVKRLVAGAGARSPGADNDSSGGGGGGGRGGLDAAYAGAAELDDGTLALRLSQWLGVVAAALVAGAVVGGAAMAVVGSRRSLGATAAVRQAVTTAGATEPLR